MDIFGSDALDFHADKFIGGWLQTFGVNFVNVLRRDALNFHGDQIVGGKIVKTFGFHAVDIGLRLGSGGGVLSAAWS